MTTTRATTRWRGYAGALVAIVGAAALVMTFLPASGTNLTVWVTFLGERYVVGRGSDASVMALLVIASALVPFGAFFAAVRVSSAAYAAVGRSKVRWAVALAGLLIVKDLSVVIVAVYFLLRVFPSLRRANSH